MIFLPWRYRFTLQPRPFPPVYRDYTDFLLFPSDIFVLAAVGLWAAAFLLRPRLLKWGPSFLSLPLAGLTLLAGLSILWSIDPRLSAYHVLRLVVLVGLYLALVNGALPWPAVALPVAGQAAIQAVVGIGQGMAQRSLGLVRWGELPLDPAWAGISVVAAGETRWLRAYGLSAHPNILGGCFALAMLALLGHYADRKSAGAAWLVAVFGLSAVGLWLTYSRAAWIAFAAGLLFWLVVLAGRRDRTALRRAGELLLAAGVMILPFAWQNLPLTAVRLNWPGFFTQAVLEHRSVAERSLLNQAGLSLAAARPATGFGLATSPLALREAWPDFPADYQPAHLVLLDAAVELGLPGGVLVLVLITAPWVAVWRMRSRLAWTVPFVTLSAMLVAVTVIGFFDYYTWLLPPGRLWQWLVWGLWAGQFLTAREAGR